MNKRLKTWQISFLFLAISGATSFLYQQCSVQSGPGDGSPYFHLFLKNLNLTANELSRLQNLSLCAKTLTFIPYSTLANPQSQAPVELEFNIGDIEIETAGTDLRYISINPGRYETIQMELHPDCASGKSLAIEKDGSPYSTTDLITLTFQGDVEISTNLTRLELTLDTIVRQLMTISADNQIKTAAESVDGEF